MIDIQPPEHTPHTWRDFYIHIATIVVGLIIAIGLEQSVEAIHHHHQRRQLVQDLRNEAINNRKVIARNLNMRNLEGWFAGAVASVDSATPTQGKLHIDLPPAPCIPGSVGTASIRYFAPSEAVLTTAREDGLIMLLPIEPARMYARLDHNYKLLGDDRNAVFNNCNTIAAMQQRLARPTPGATTLRWTLTPAQAELLAQTASNTETGIKGLCFRLRWSDIYEQGLIAGETKADIKMMTMNQERFEDPKDVPSPEDQPKN
ncbi:MAG: hypothetical protein WB439_13880 [Acidobacteriaceae bacterium]